MESEDEEEDDDDDDDDFEDESLAERLAGLAEMFPDGFTDGCVNMARVCLCTTTSIEKVCRSVKVADKALR